MHTSVYLDNRSCHFSVEKPFASVWCSGRKLYTLWVISVFWSTAPQTEMLF